MLHLLVEFTLYLKVVKNVVEVTKQVVFNGETVLASERIFSIFEQHVELIRRGKKNKREGFGHKTLIYQTKDKFITDYDVMEKQLHDNEHVEGIMDRHKEQFGKYPKVLTGDKGFRSGGRRWKSKQKK